MKLAAVDVDKMATALIVKAADRLANCRQAGKLGMYRKEHEAFRKAAFRPGLCDEIWKELDGILADCAAGLERCKHCAGHRGGTPDCEYHYWGGGCGGANCVGLQSSSTPKEFTLEDFSLKLDLDAFSPALDSNGCRVHKAP